MKINNPKVTASDDARIGVKEEVRSGFLDWLFTCNVIGEDGERYEFGTSILSMNIEKIDLVTMFLAKGHGHSEQLRNSIYKVRRYPGTLINGLGAITIKIVNYG